MIKSIGLRHGIDRMENIVVKQHTMYQSILMHLLPGCLITIAFLLLSPWLHKANLPHLLAFLISIAIVLIPFELGVLFWSGIRQNKKLSLQGIVLNREPLKSKDIPIALILFMWAAFTFTILGQMEVTILDRFFRWVPDWFQADQFSLAGYSQSVRIVTFVLFLLLNGLAGPMVEELYFRGFLMPRMAFLRGWEPLVNIVLFSLYHFFSPWGNISRILGFLPMAIVVRRKKTILISILAHCMLNISYCLLKLPDFF